jgi:hypothetical protein
MNFGNWIVVAFVLFAIFIGTLVVVCVRQDINLVSKDYYNEELVYQDQMTRISNTLSLADRPSITKINSTTLGVVFKAPIEKGELKLFCPADPKMDKNFSLKLLPNNNQLFDIASLNKGMYRARLFWTVDGDEYFLEEVINI